MQIKKQNKQFAALLEQYEQALWRVAITYEANFAQQEELFQEMLIEIWKSLDNFENRSSLKTYIYRIAHNVAFRHVSKQVKSHDSDDSELEASTSRLETDFQNQQQINQLTQVIRKLSFNQREIVSLSLEGLTYPEISQIAGVSESNVGVILNRAKKRIKELMEKSK